MQANPAQFIASTFGSIWALELLLQLRTSPPRSFPREELVRLLRASDVVVQTSGRALIAAGLVVEEHDGSLRYAPASADLEVQVDATEHMYRTKPDAVRRLIFGAGTTGLTAFSDAFKLRKDKE